MTNEQPFDLWDEEPQQPTTRVVVSQPAPVAAQSFDGPYSYGDSIDAPCRFCSCTVLIVCGGKGPHVASLRCRSCGRMDRWLPARAVPA